MRSHPFAAAHANLRTHFTKTAKMAGASMSVEEARKVTKWIGFDARLKHATAELFVGVTPDGWAGPDLAVRLRFAPGKQRRLRLSCRPAWPKFRPLNIRIGTPWGDVIEQQVGDETPFIIEVDLPARDSGVEWELRALADDWFVPAEMEKGSNDGRHLAYRVEAVELS